MARHKQTAPRRKQVQQQDHSSEDDAVQEQEEEQQQQQQHALPVEPEQPYAVAAVFTAPAQQTQHAQVPLGAVAEFLVATKSAGTTPAGAAPETVTVQLFTKQHAPGWRASKPKQVLLFSWLCLGEDEHGPKYEVCCELPEQCGTSILQLLQQGYMSISIQQQQRQHDSSQQSRLPQVLQPVQYATLTADSTYVSAFECDVLMAPEEAAVEAGLQRCSLLAATAAKAAGGPTASLAQQSHALLEALAPLLPAQHVSLMAAAMAPGLLQPQHRQAQQQQQQQQQGGAGSNSGAEQLAAAGDNQEAPKAAGALTLWRLQLCLTQRAMLASTHHSQQQQQQEQKQEQGVQDLQSIMGWLVPHWCCSHSSQHSAEFDAAEVYRVVKPSGQEVELQGNPPGLKPQLRPYQRRAVAWMLGLELGQHASAAAAAAAAGAAAAHAAPSYSGSVQQLLAGLLQPYSEWRSVLLLTPGSNNSASSGNTSAGALPGARLGLRQLYLHPVLAHLSVEAPEEPPVVPGGVLADEMGLGKTCELLSLIMSNRFKPATGTPQQEQHTGPLSANLPEQQQLSRRSSSGGGGSGTNACSRCGESFGARYTRDGKIMAETPACDSDGDTPMAPDDDTDDYVPRASREKGGKQPAGRGTKRMARSQQLPPLPPHGTGQHGGKRKRVAPRRLQESVQQEEEEQEQQQSRAGSVSAHEPQGAAAAASGAGAAGALCSLCMREIALQEVEQDCGTTLIVVPANILVQWVDELQRHTLPGSLSIKVYSGQPQADTSAARGASRSRSSSPAPSSVRGAAAATAASGKAAASNEVVTAAQLAAADIVLTTYDILRREVVLQPQTEAAPERSLRHRKRYAVVPTPLSRLSFWRLVLDEAQLAGGTGKAAEMAQHVRAQHRWAITGTPISHGGKSDLLGLLKFLQVPHIPAGIGGLLRLLCPVTGGLMWRTAKADVLLEMGIPPQHHHTTNLRLSAIERHWYNRSHAECAAKARKVLQDALEQYIFRRDAGRGRRSSGSGNADAAVAAAKAAAKRVTAAIIAAGGDEQQLDAAAAELLDLQLGPAQLKKLLLPLLRLRQACCHPQVGASGIRAVISSHNSSKPLTMDQILSVLISRARVDAEEAQRQVAGALNGLAALLWLAQQQPEAVTAYREVLGLSETSKGVVRLDSFQLLHTLHNLAELLAELQRKQQQRQRQQRGCSAAAAAAAAGAPVTAAAAESDDPYGPGVPRTLRDDSLASEAAAIREQYLAQRQAELATAHQAFLKAAKDALPAGLSKSKRQQQSAGVAGSSGAGGGAQEGILDELLAAGDDLMGTVGDGGGASAGGEEAADGEGTAAGTSVGEGWYIAVIDALKEAGADEEVAEVIRVKLQESDTYIRQVEKNATTMANKFKTLGGLKLLLSQELSAINKHQADCLGTLCQLQEDVGGSDGPDQVLIEQAGQCGRCRSEMGVFGQVCRHCKLDESMRTLEARLFRLSTKALAAGTQLDASEAAAQAQAAAFRRVVGRGGLNEQAAENMAAAGTSGTAAAAAASRLGGIVGPSSGAGARRADAAAAVSEAQIARHPSEAERVLRLLQQQISKLGMTSYLPGVHEAAKQHLEQLKGSRKLFLAANSLSIAQRQLLYAHDELSMALLRITTRAEGEQVSAHEALYKLSRAEQVLKLEELTVEKAVAAGDLRRALGTLNYLKTIAGARTRVAAAATAAAGGDSKQGAGSQQAQQQQQQDKPDDPRAAAAAAALQRAAAGSHEAACQERTQVVAAAQQQQPEQPASAHTPAAAAGGAASAQGAADGAEEEKCPICFCAVAAAAAVLPCGHVLCCDCADSLAERIPAGTAAAHRYISCPSCRAHTHVSDVAYVNSEQSSKHAYVATSSTMAVAGSTSALAAADATDPGAAAAAAAAVAGAEYPFQGEQQLVLAGSYGTKIDAVVRRVLCVLQQDPANKVLVFSSWADVLGIVSHALSDNGILHAFAKDRKGLLAALERFKGCQVSSAELAAGGKGRPAAAASSSGSRASSSTRVVSAQGAGGSSGLQDSEQQQEEELRGLDGMDLDADSSDAAGGDDTQQQQQSEGSPADDSPAGRLTAGQAAAAAAGAGVSGAAAAVGPRVLLLLVSQGGLGLNLTEAQHVVLLEPLLDPALDVQAIGRVNRFGQTRTTHVHRFIVQDTVEENVARLSRERAAAMNMSAAVPAKGGTGGAAEVLLVRDVAALLCSKWREGAADP